MISLTVWIRKRFFRLFLLYCHRFSQKFKIVYYIFSLFSKGNASSSSVVDDGEAEHELILEHGFSTLIRDLIVATNTVKAVHISVINWQGKNIKKKTN